MEITLPQLLTILGMAVATYSTRVLSYLFLRGRDFSPDVKKLFEMMPCCRVSTDQEEQLLSYENQVNYYTNYISENPLYEYAGTYADEGISGTNTKKRDEFNRMIADCR